MKIRIDLPEPLCRNIRRIATEQGLSLSEWMKKLLERSTSPPSRKSSTIKEPDLQAWREELL